MKLYLLQNDLNVFPKSSKKYSVPPQLYAQKNLCGYVYYPSRLLYSKWEIKPQAGSLQKHVEGICSAPSTVGLTFTRSSRPSDPFRGLKKIKFLPTRGLKSRCWNATKINCPIYFARLLEMSRKCFYFNSCYEKVNATLIYVGLTWSFYLVVLTAELPGWSFQTLVGWHVARKRCHS